MKKNDLIRYAMPIGVFLLPFGLYLYTAARTVTMEDSASFLISANFFGVAHPPGYPLYTILAGLFSRLPFATVAYRIHLVNAFFAASGVVLFYFLMVHLLALCNRKLSIADHFLTFLASLVLAFSYSYWFQAITAEVYMMNMFFFLLLLNLSFYLYHSFNRKIWFSFVFVVGLSLSNHWPLIILCSPGFLVLLWHRKLEFLKNSLPALPFFLLGLLPYLHLFFSVHYSEFFFYGKLDSLELVWQHIIRKEQWAMDSLQTASIKHAIQFLTDFLLFPTHEMNFLYLPFFYGGIYFAYQSLPKRIFFSLLFFLLASPILLLFSFRTEYNDFTAELFRYWHLVPYSIGVIFITFAFSALYQKWTKYLAKYENYRFVLFVFFYFILFWQVGKNFQSNHLRNDSFARDYAKIILESLPKKAALITNTDTDLGGQIGYVHFVEGTRPDVKIISQVSALFPERFYSRKDEDDIRKKQVLFLNFISDYMEKGWRIFTTRRITAFNAQYRFPLRYKQYGLYLEILNPGDRPSLSFHHSIKQARTFLTRVEQGEYAKHWNYYRNFASRTLCHFLMLQGVEHSMYRTNRWCKLIKAQMLHVYNKDYSAADQLFREIISLPLTDLYIYERVSIHRQFLLNRIYWTKNKKFSQQRAKVLLQEAVELVFPIVKELEFCNNPLARNLKELYYGGMVDLDIDYLNTTFAKCKD